MDTSTAHQPSPQPPGSTNGQPPQPRPQPPQQQPLFGAEGRADISSRSPSSQRQSSAYNNSNSNNNTAVPPRLVATSGFCALTPALAGASPVPLPHHHHLQAHQHTLVTNGGNTTVNMLQRICHQQQQQQQVKEPVTSAPTSKLLGPMPSASQMMGHLMAINNGIPNDLDLSNIDSFQSELECDVDQVIRHELSVDGNLDFNFAEPQSSVTATAGHHWVH